jgi:phosphoglycerate dehydrogenase-like enzyme
VADPTSEKNPAASIRPAGRHRKVTERTPIAAGRGFAFVKAAFAIPPPPPTLAPPDPRNWINPVPATPNKHRCAVLDDYQNIAMKIADWGSLAGEVEFTVFNRPLGSIDDIAKALQGYSMIVLTRERTAFPRALIEKLKDVRLIVSTGMRNWMLDIEACRERGIVASGTPTFGSSTTTIAIGLMLELTRRIGYESEQLKKGAFWQSTIGPDIEGKTLGVIGLGRLGARVSKIAIAMGMNAIAWSQNLTPERCKEAGVGYAGSKEALLREADIVSMHVVLGPRTRGIVGAKELALMKPTAYLINTGRGPLVDEAALIEALRNRKIAGAGLDVYDIEPLPVDHPLRQLDNVVLSPHLGYVTAENFRGSYGCVVEDIRAFLDGKPIRLLDPV